MEFDHPLKISSKDMVIFKEVDGSLKNKNNISLLSDSVNSKDTEVTSIYSSPSKCEFFFLLN